MIYDCTDCSYSGANSGRKGECPACGSFSLVRRRGEGEETPPPSRWRIVLLVALWTYLLIHVVWKLST